VASTRRRLVHEYLSVDAPWLASVVATDVPALSALSLAIEDWLAEAG
jgi:uncharacterized protein with HEPN domain